MVAEENEGLKIVALFMSGGYSLETEKDVVFLLDTAGFDIGDQKVKSAVQKFLKKKKK